MFQDKILKDITFINWLFRQIAFFPDPIAKLLPSVCCPRTQTTIYPFSKKLYTSPGYVNGTETFGRWDRRVTVVDYLVFYVYLILLFVDYSIIIH